MLSETEHDRVVDAICQMLAGLNLAQGDQVLNEARLIVWGVAFRGSYPEPDTDQLKAHPAWVIATSVLPQEGLSLHEMTKLIESARLKIWLETFPDANVQVFPLDPASTAKN